MTRKKNQKPAKPEPGPRNQAAIEAAIRSNAERPIRASTEFEKIEGVLTCMSPHADAVGNAIFLKETFGSASTSFSTSCLGHLEWLTRMRGAATGESLAETNAGLALIGAIEPRDELEAALALQMAGCHALTIDMLGRAKNTERTDLIQLYGNMAVKLQRTFTTQIEALGRMRGKGQQTVRVEHVTVESGAQAIVGDVHHHPQPPRGETRGQSKSEAQPYETRQSATSSEGCAALPGPNAAWNGVPIPGDAQRPVPDPRRTVTRRAARKSKRA